MSNPGDFVIENGILTKYVGPGGDVVIPEGVTSIGKEAFRSCSSLTSVTIPDGVTRIGDSAFSWCISLAGVEIPDSVRNIGNWTFFRCSSLTSVTIPESVTSIGEGAFYNCSSLTNLTIPASVTSIGDSAFQGCSGLTSVTIPESVTSIDNYAFRSCSSLTSVTIPNSVNYLGWGAFSSCDQLERVEICGEPPKTGTQVFADCPKLKIKLAAGVGKTTSSIPTDFADAAKTMDEETLAWILLFQTTKAWRTKAIDAAEQRDVGKILQMQIELLQGMKKVRQAVVDNAANTCVSLSREAPEAPVKALAGLLRERDWAKQLSVIEQDPVLREMLIGR